MQASSKSFSSPFPSPPPRLLYKIQVSKVTDRQRHGNAEIIDAQIKMYVEMVEEGNEKNAAGQILWNSHCLLFYLLNLKCYTLDLFL